MNMTGEDYKPVVSWPTVGLARNPVKLEKAVVNAALYANQKALTEIAAHIPAFSFRDRSHGKAYSNIIKALAVMPDGFGTEELAKAAGVPAALVVDLQADLPLLSLKELIKLLLAVRMHEDAREGLDPAPWAQAIATIENPPFVFTQQAPFVNLADLDLSGNLAPSWLLKGYLEQDSLAVLFGPPGSGKSFTALALCMAVATGSTWNGQLAEQGVVVYLAGEGHAGLRRRLKAWLHHNNQPAPETLIISNGALPFDERTLKTSSAAACAAADRTGVPVRLFVIDTLARHIVGEENSATDMGAFIRIADSLKAAFPGSSVLIVHHTGKADRDSGRGSSSLKGAADCEIRCMDHCLTFTKMKDGRAPDPVMFKLRQVQIGVNDEGLPVTSCVPEYGTQAAHDAVPAAVPLLTRHEQQALEALQAACVAENRPNAGKQYMATVEAWRIEFYRLRRIEEASETTDTMKKQFARVRFGTERGGGLVVKEVVHISDDSATLLRLSDNAKVKTTIDGTRENVPGHSATCPGIR